MPPNLSAAIARMPSDVPFRIRTPYNQLVTMIESFIRREQVTREGEEWNIAGSPGGGGGADLAAFFPRYLPGAVAYVTAANQFMAPQTIYFSTEGSQSFVGLTLQATVELVGDSGAIALQVLGTGGSSIFSVAGGGNVAAAGNADFAGTLAVGTADAFTVAATGAFIALSGVCEVRTGANATVGLRIRQNSSSQSGNLFELTSSAGTVLAAFDADANTLIMPSSFAIGASTNISTFTTATAVGGSATVSANGGSAFGNGAFAGNNAVAVGINATCTTASGVAIGVNSAVSKANAIAIGNTATAAFAQAAVFGGGTALATNEMVYGNIDSLNTVAHFRLTGHSSVQARSLFRLTTAWIVSTDASHTVRVTMGPNDFNSLTTAREAIRMDSTGAGVSTWIGFGSDHLGLVVNDNGNDADTRIEGDTATQLLVCDAGLDAVQIGTTTAGVIADFRSATIVFNEDGADRDIRFEGDNEPNLFYTDASTDRLGIGTATPATRFNVVGPTLGTPHVQFETPATNDDPKTNLRQNRVATTDATVTTLETIAITASNTYLIDAHVVARRTGGAAGTADDGAVYIRRAMVTTKAGTVTINAVQDGLTQEDQAAWDCTFDVSGTDIRVRVTGAVDNNVVWHSHVWVTLVGT